MKQYKVKIDPEAFTDIQEITDWYNRQQKGLGQKFQKSVVQNINALQKDPQIFAIRYKEIRCMIIKKFPYMVHFYVNDQNNTVEVMAVLSTDRNPKNWDKIAQK
jgi:plasmid stabilization system protein ParE